ncbi:MAG: class I SAM-dependent DNA methyltransferase [Myxococcota bacterium]
MRSSSHDVYDLIARVYDQPEHLDVTEAFFRATAPLVKARPRGTAVLDVACGTGVLADRLARRRVPVVGVDDSRAMLAIARRRCRRHGARVRLQQDDLLRFRAPRRCAVALACGDVFNHFLARGPLVRALRCIRRNLTPGGVLAFDATTRHFYERYWDERDYLLEGDGGDLAMCCSWDPARQVASARMIAYAKTGSGRSGGWTKAETTLREKLHGDAFLRGVLAEAGFRRVERRPWSPWPDVARKERALWTARVPDGAHARP